jgi:hypothetical protein
MKCKNCKEKFTPVRFNQKFCFDPLCLQVWIATEKAKQWKKRKKELKDELETLPDLLSKAQKTFNLYIRTRDKGKVCISCLKPPKKVNAGHFFSSGGHSNVRFDEENVHIQCEHCNSYLSGNLIEYKKNLKKRIGHDKYVLLTQRAYIEKKWTREELKELIELYKQKIKEHENNRKD